MDHDLDIKPIAKSQQHFQKWVDVYPFYANVKKDSGRNDRSLLFRNLYLVTQMDYFAFPTEIADFLYPHLLNTFFPSLDVLL